MKKNKLLVVSVLFLLILLIQPGNFTYLKEVFTQHDLASQLNIVDSTEEKNQALTELIRLQNRELRFKDFDEYALVSEVNNQANFTAQELSLEKGTWIHYSDLDWLDRAGIVNAMLGKESFSLKKDRGDTLIFPAGWKKINEQIYVPSQLLGAALGGEPGNKKNLVTATNALNKEAQVYEKLVVDYIQETGNHVRYRVTPIFKNVELLPRGIRLEAQSIEDDSLSFDVYIWNVQMGYEIYHLTGSFRESRRN
ncbi:DNA/RNA non-specific endonuclease [Streptococcus danieliae]|uniref:DNA/RNA non-specific endonuclease n=1 Tax=Streptococcus danieliae TaxID=747656 RepID=UPI0021C98BA3|nr:DNA/RNA non-specific endonuclease [Streptococcus danieliae]MCU0081779.1 DNA/RNA non-specific endonuclease [Streptococcus danieliae]